MTSSTRLRLSVAIIVMSAVFAFTIVQSPSVASAVASGYIAIVLTVFLMVNFWKKP